MFVSALFLVADLRYAVLHKTHKHLISYGHYCSHAYTNTFLGYTLWVSGYYCHRLGHVPVTAHGNKVQARRWKTVLCWMSVCNYRGVLSSVGFSQNWMFKNVFPFGHVVIRHGHESALPSVTATISLTNLHYRHVGTQPQKWWNKIRLCRSLCEESAICSSTKTEASIYE